MLLSATAAAIMAALVCAVEEDEPPASPPTLNMLPLAVAAKDAFDVAADVDAAVVLLLRAGLLWLPF